MPGLLKDFQKSACNALMPYDYLLEKSNKDLQNWGSEKLFSKFLWSFSTGMWWTFCSRVVSLKSPTPRFNSQWVGFTTHPELIVVIWTRVSLSEKTNHGMSQTQLHIKRCGVCEGSHLMLPQYSPPTCSQRYVEVLHFLYPFHFIYVNKSGAVIQMCLAEQINNLFHRKPPWLTPPFPIHIMTP